MYFFISRYKIRTIYNNNNNIMRTDISRTAVYNTIRVLYHFYSLEIEFIVVKFPETISVEESETRRIVLS